MTTIIKKILIVGSGPLPNDKEGIREAAGLRTEQFISPLKKAGHAITVFCIHNTPNEKKHDSKSSIIRSHRGHPHLLRQLRHVLSTMSFDVVIGVNTFPAFIVSKCIDEKTPFWADLNGWIMSEYQAKAYREKNDEYFSNAWRQERHVLLRADNISTVSERQKFAVLGELCASGHMRHDNFLENLIIPIENCTKWFDTDQRHACRNGDNKDVFLEKNRKSVHDTEVDNFDKKMSTMSKAIKTEKVFMTQESTISTKNVSLNNKTSLNKENKRDNDSFDKTDNEVQKDVEPSTLFRGKVVPDNAFVVAWIGGYNNWVDERTLFESLEHAMSLRDNIYFVSTGGKIGSVANTPFTNFKMYIENSPYKNRFIFLGWIKTEDMAKVYQESTIGMNIDFDCLETRTGARNRINEMMKFGLPVVSTNGSEIAQRMHIYNAGIAVDYQDCMKIVNAIISLYEMSPEQRKKIGENGQKYIFTIAEESIVMQPVLDFVCNPRLRNKKTIAIQGIFPFLSSIIRYGKENGIKKGIAKILQFF